MFVIQFLVLYLEYNRRGIVKCSSDAYLLHESNQYITFNIRVKVVMKDTILFRKR